MIQTWKLPHLVKGSLTWIPFLNAWRLRRGTTGGSDSPRYCYSVWLRHLVVLSNYGFSIRGAFVGELGPGDSIGSGLAALLSGAGRYVGLDIVPFSMRSDTEAVYESLVKMYLQRNSIPDQSEFTGIRPTLDSYSFPEEIIEWTGFEQRVDYIREEIKNRPNRGQFVRYKAPWTSHDDIDSGSLDLVFSQAVLEHVDDLEEAYGAMFNWLRPGGYGSHVIDFTAHHLSPYWNGHWAYSERQWRFVRGQREFLLNRQPLSIHLQHIRQTGFEVLQLTKNYGAAGLPDRRLAKKYRLLDGEDLRVRGVTMILLKPKCSTYSGFLNKR